eukprot:823792_1
MPSQRFLVFAGAENPPVKTTDRKRDCGSFSIGVQKDLENLQYKLKDYKIKHYSVYDSSKKLKCSQVIQIIKAGADKIDRNPPNGGGGGITIYYTGYGETHTGNWCFEDGKITLADVIQSIKSVNQNCEITISCECSYSGRWAKDLKTFENKYKTRAAVFCACDSNEIAHESKHGGVFTAFYESGRGSQLKAPLPDKQKPCVATLN